MGRHRTLALGLAPALAAALLLVAGACTADTIPPAERSASRARPYDSPMFDPPTTVGTTTTLPPLPQPILIPEDSYAPEPVVEIGTMEIPALGLVHRIYQGVTLHNIDRGPSHWPGTADPGQPGNTVFAGHRITNSHPFLHLDDLVAGDQVVFTVGGVRSVYVVTGSMVVGPGDTWIADQTPSATGTLYACHPPGSQAKRFVVKLALTA
ncbi:MAG: sortase [Actinomycetota bacterium]|nr:sortase [Actinomycetota bacterium]